MKKGDLIDDITKWTIDSINILILNSIVTIDFFID